MRCPRFGETTFANVSGTRIVSLEEFLSIRCSDSLEDPQYGKDTKATKTETGFMASVFVVFVLFPYCGVPDGQWSLSICNNLVINRNFDLLFPAFLLQTG
jgi:hypothetical protein